MRTYPIMSAAAVFIYRPSPNGFGGTGETGKLIFGSSCAAALGTAAAEDSTFVDMMRREMRAERYVGQPDNGLVDSKRVHEVRRVVCRGGGRASR